MVPLTNHARIRSQQRGIAPIDIDMLIQFGATEKAHDGAVKHFWDKASRKRLEAYTGRQASKSVAPMNCYVVVGRSGAVITAAHRTQRIVRQ